MSFRSLFSSGNNEASSSRKRSFAEITRSESRSQSPQHPSSKRRRTGSALTPSTSTHRNRSSSPHTSIRLPTSVSERYEGDGLDYRRPVMSTLSATQTGLTAFIDLTADDSGRDSPRQSVVEAQIRDHGSHFRAEHRRRTPEERWYAASEARRSTSRARLEELELHRRRQDEREANLARLQQASNRGPRFGRDIIGDDADEPEVIDLMDSDDTEDMELEPALYFEEDLFEAPNNRSSPEITFVSERRAPAYDNVGAVANDLRRLPTPQDRRPPIMPNTFQNLREFVSRNGNYRAMSDNEIDEAREALDRETLDRIDGIREGHLNHQNRGDARNRVEQDARDRRFQPFGEFPIARPSNPASLGIPEFIDVDELEMNLDMDYENAAFQVGNPNRLEIIEPPPWPAMNARRGDTPVELVKEPYLRPRPRAKGFTMNFAEDDYLECPSCHEELALGDEGAAKAQVWMVKTCGHVYCGECATNRAVSKRKTQKIETNVTPFKKCLVQECGKSVVAKNAMFQIYL